MFKGLVYRSFITILLIALVGVPSVSAQDEDSFMLEEITVTAEKKEASSQKTPLSISAVTGENIRDMGLASVDEVLKDVPNVVVQSAARGFLIAIRGLGSDMPPGSGENSVSSNFDGVYNFRAESGTIGYYDLSRVEVLRGPQGTLYGRNATAGVVNVVSKNPSDKFEGYGTVEVGTDSLLRLEGAVNAPISDDVSARMAFVSVNRDGFLTNGQNDAVGSSARAKVLYEPSEDVSVLLTSEFTKIGGKGTGFVSLDDYNSGNPYQNSTAEYQSQDYESYKFSANIEVAAGPGVVTFIPAYQHGEGVNFADMEPNGFQKAYDPLDANQYSAELRYASPADNKVQWVGGLYYYELNNESWDYGHAPYIIEVANTTSYAAFGQVTYPFTDKIRGTVGIRSGVDEKENRNDIIENAPADADVSEASIENDWSAFDWKVGLEADFSESILGYLSIATGHRPGGHNGATGNAFDPEDLLSTEVGVKSRFLNNRLQVNANAFYYDYQDYQYVDFYWRGSTLYGGVFSAGKTKSYGGELEMQAMLSYETIVDFSATYLHARFDSDFFLHDGDVEINMNGRALPHAPDFTLNAGIEHTFSMGYGGYLTPRVSVRWTDDQYVAPFQDEARFQEAFTKVDASIRYYPADQKWSLNLYVRNATDEAVKTGYSASEVFVGSPRQIGGVFSVKF